MSRQPLKVLPIGLGRVRHALGDGATEAQARRVWMLLDKAGLLGKAATAIDGGRLVGLAEFAELMNRTPQAVKSWRGTPEPIAHLKAGPVWDRIDVERFRAENPQFCGAGVA